MKNKIIFFFQIFQRTAIGGGGGEGAVLSDDLVAIVRAFLEVPGPFSAWSVILLLAFLVAAAVEAVGFPS